jgi:hypothetical protein
MVCRGLLLMLDRAGKIELPPVKRVVRNRIAERQKPEPLIPDTRPVRGPLASITPLEFIQVRRTPEEALLNSLVEQYHYLGYEQPVGEHVKYLVKARGQVIACLAWQSAPRHLKVRDRLDAVGDCRRRGGAHPSGARRTDPASRARRSAAQRRHRHAVLRMAREPAQGGKADRTGVFTTGIVSTQQGRRIALYFTGRQHAGENLRDVLQHRAADLAPPLQMCDALSRNIPKLSDGAEILLAHCLAHGRRQFVEVAANFPEPCRYVLETLGDVYKYDAEAPQHHLSAAERLAFHQQHSGR